MRKQRLLYLANNRLPTEKAHGLQMVQNCEALANAGYDVTLVAPDRINTPEMRRTGSLWQHYGVTQNFAFLRLPCLDLFPLFPRYYVAFFTQTFTYLLALTLWLPFQRADRRKDVIYTRDAFIAFALALLRPLLWRQTTLVYEAHQLRNSRIGRRVQHFVMRRARTVAITQHLADELRTRGAESVLVAHDGIRAGRFAAVPDQAAARAQLGWPPDAFIVGWVGRLSMLGMDKGVGQLIPALAQVKGAHLAIVGGPEDMVAALRERWIAAGMPKSRFLAAGQVVPEDVPLYLSAFDVCTMPHPWTAQFAYYTSPIKLFEYMASRRALVASDLPSFAEVVTHEESALLVPPGDVDALAAAITRLRDDPVLRERLAARAYDLVMQRYTWAARAAAIRAFVEGK